jgi:non-specific serine/threonine protein kinase
MAGHFSEGSRWLGRALACAEAAPVASSAARMKALHAAGWLAHVQRDSATACRLLEQGLAIADQRQDPWWRAWILHALGRVAYFDNDAVRATELGQQSLATAQALGDSWLEGWALHLLGLAAYIARDYPAAHGYYERCLSIRQALGHVEGLLIVQHLDGVALYRLGRPAEALAVTRQALAIARQLNSSWFYTCLLPIFASFAAQHQPTRAARLGGAVTALSESAHTLPIPITEALFNESMRVARRKLGDLSFNLAWAVGLAMSLEAALAEAQAVDVAAVGAAPARLTPTELSVLRQLARGRTTRQIATDLVVAASTVDRHISHIYRKIGCRGRSAATMFALEHGLV